MGNRCEIEDEWVIFADDMVLFTKGEGELHRMGEDFVVYV